MRWPEIALMFLASIGLLNQDSLRGQRPPAKISVGYWFWQGSSSDITWSDEKLDVLFVHAGSIWNSLNTHSGGQWLVRGELPRDLPSAREYWLVFRCEKQDVPSLKAAPRLAATLSDLREQARARNLNVVGIQLDIDSPTGALSQYASFLREVRKNLPAGFELSITALLDWFTPGTPIADVIQAVDVFVPQFYDVAGINEYGDKGTIAAKISSAQWGPVFNRFGKRFRIGISTFGRARFFRREDTSESTSTIISGSYYADLAPLDVATNPALQLKTSRTPANELELIYRTMRSVQIGYNRFEPGVILKFNLATPESVRSATDSARRMGGLFAGVVFFRWPAARETLAMQPDEVLIAAGLKQETGRKRTDLLVKDGRCATVKCVDLFLEDTSAFSSQPVSYRIRSSTDLEYFLPGESMPVRMEGASELEWSLPPYCARGRMYIGRAFTAGPAEFSVEKQ